MIPYTFFAKTGSDERFLPPQMQSLPVEVGSSSSSSAPSDTPGSVVQVSFPSAQTSVLDGLNRQREDGQLCDLSIHVQGHVFKAHRCVLAASSPYFHDQVGAVCFHFITRKKIDLSKCAIESNSEACSHSHTQPVYE